MEWDFLDEIKREKNIRNARKSLGKSLDSYCENLSKYIEVTNHLKQEMDIYKEKLSEQEDLTETVQKIDELIDASYDRKLELERDFYESRRDIHLSSLNPENTVAVATELELAAHKLEEQSSYQVAEDSNTFIDLFSLKRYLDSDLESIADLVYNEQQQRVTEHISGVSVAGETGERLGIERTETEEETLTDLPERDLLPHESESYEPPTQEEILENGEEIRKALKRINRREEIRGIQ